ncbi:MAG: sulfur carrier protein ThiS [Verrucomicrobiota bacterium]|nr:sulfur carrier protein ThiS [Verrucomicrobiota bacterium]
MAFTFAESMKLTVNGETLELPGEPSLADVCRTLGANAERAAVLLNDTVIPRTQYDRIRFREGDRIDLVTLVAGG